MKLNYKRTIFVGFAFFLICAFWQAYDNTIPLILTNKFGMRQASSGVIMALDNIFALFMLPLFGAISDRCGSRLGRRTPFILFGTIAAVCAILGIAFADASQVRMLGEAAAVDDANALGIIYDAEAGGNLITPSGETFVLEDLFTRDEFTAIRSETADGEGNVSANSEYTEYVVPARTAYVRKLTRKSPSRLVLFVIFLLAALIAMATFRSPAVALMPDVTIKPLRSSANAVINLMGSLGGIIALILGMKFAMSAAGNSMSPYTGYLLAIGAVMVFALAVFMVTVREPALVEEMRGESRKYGLAEDEAETGGGGAQGRAAHRLPPDVRRSLLFILASIILWFMGYNAVTSKYSVYAGSILMRDYNLTLIIAQVAAIISYIPVGIISSRIGRKKTILAGVVMLCAAFGTAAGMRASSPPVLMNCMFALAGIAWATINVNSFPMVVEMCSEADVGKYTGIYYTASMSAQVLTPILSGFLMDRLGMTVLFPYAVAFTAAAFVTMLFVRHGDSKPEAKRGLEALEDME